MKIVYSKDSLKVADLKPNLLYEKSQIDLSQYFINEAKLFNYYDVPVVTEGKVVLNHYESVMAAKRNGKEKMDVVIAKGLHEDDILRFIAFTAFYKKLTYAQRYLLIDTLENYLRLNDKGKEWVIELRNQGYKDINEQIGAIVNCHRETIKYLKRIGQHGVESFDESKTLSEMLYHAEQLALNRSIEIEKAILEEEGPPRPREKAPIAKFEAKDLQFSLMGTNAKISFKGREFQMSEANISNTSKTVTYLFKSSDEESSVVITIKNWANLLN